MYNVHSYFSLKNWGKEVQSMVKCFPVLLHIIMYTCDNEKSYVFYVCQQYNLLQDK